MVIAVNVGTPTTYTPSHVVHDNAYKYATQHPAIPFLASSSQPFYFLCEILHFIDGNVLPVAHNNPVLSVHFLPHFRDQVVLVPSCHSLQHRSNCPLDVAEAISHSLGWAIDLAGSATKGSRVPVFLGKHDFSHTELAPRLPACPVRILHATRIGIVNDVPYTSLFRLAVLEAVDVSQFVTRLGPVIDSFPQWTLIDGPVTRIGACVR